jgi:ribosome biogenesis protein YTM1
MVGREEGTVVDVDFDSEVGEKVRVVLRLAPEFQHLKHLQIAPTSSSSSSYLSEPIIAVPSTVTRSGLSVIVNHLLHMEEDEDTGDNKSIHDHDDDDDDDDDNDNDDEKTNKERNWKAASVVSYRFDFTLGKPPTSTSASSSNNQRLQQRLLRGGIEAQARKLGISLEEPILVTYFPLQHYVPSDQGTTRRLPDWISSVEFDSGADLLTVGCYDGIVRCWKEEEGEGDLDGESAGQDENGDRRGAPLTTEVASFRASTGPIKCLATIASSSSGAVLATGSMDHTLRMHRIALHNSLDRRQPTIPSGACVIINCVGGHNASVESLAVSPARSPSSSSGSSSSPGWLVASGDFNGVLCLWSVDPALLKAAGSDEDDNRNDSDSALAMNKKARTDRKSAAAAEKGHASAAAAPSPSDVSPAVSLQAHSGNVSGLSFGNHHKRHCLDSDGSTAAADPSFDSFASAASKLVTGSWDHSIKLWDIEHQEKVLALNGSRVVTCLDTSYHAEGIVASGHPDCSVRLWDVRVGGSGKGGESAAAGNSSHHPVLAVADQTTWIPSHRAWITNVRWSAHDPYRLVSSSHDGMVKLWDLRASLPVQTLRPVEKSVLGSDDDDNKVLCVALGRRDKRIYAGGTDCVLRLYTASTRW